MTSETAGMEFGERKYFDERTWGHGLCTLRAGHIDRLRANAACHDRGQVGVSGEELYAKMTKGDESKLEAALRWRNDDAIPKRANTRRSSSTRSSCTVSPSIWGEATRTNTRRS